MSDLVKEELERLGTSRTIKDAKPLDYEPWAEKKETKMSDNTFIIDHINGDKPIGKDTRVRFQISKHNKIEVYMNPKGNLVIHAVSDCIDDFIMAPCVSNEIEVGFGVLK